MTAPNSRLFHKILVAALLITGCGSEKIELASHKCQAIVVLDKTNSVTYITKLPGLQQKLSRNLEATYALATKNIQCFRIVITSNTRVFPESDYFDQAFPYAEEENRTTEQAIQIWKTEKRKWITDEVRQIVSQIESPCTSNTTDIFSIFSGIQMVQKGSGPLDSVNVYIFSDMINTTSPINMLKDLNIQNAQEKGKTVCQNLINEGQIVTENTRNLYLTIYTPDKMGKTAVVNQFWKGFFECWGLGDNQYHFE